jgi:hypothetical protein
MNDFDGDGVEDLLVSTISTGMLVRIASWSVVNDHISERQMISELPAEYPTEDLSSCFGGGSFLLDVGAGGDIDGDQLDDVLTISLLCPASLELTMHSMTRLGIRTHSRVAHFHWTPRLALVSHRIRSHSCAAALIVGDYAGDRKYALMRLDGTLLDL